MYEKIYYDNLYNNQLFKNLFCERVGYQIFILLQHLNRFHLFIGIRFIEIKNLLQKKHDFQFQGLLSVSFI